MKKAVLFFVIFLIGCSSNKHIQKDKNISEFNPDSHQIVNKSIQIKNLKTDSTEKKIILSETSPEYEFSIFPVDTFSLGSMNPLNLVIIGDEQADISLSWKDESGSWKTVKYGSKVDKVYTINYDSKYVSENIGYGQKVIKAEILFDRMRAPIVLEKSVFIKEQETNYSHDKDIGSINLDLTSALIFDDIYFDLGQWKIPSYKFNSNYTVIIAKAVKVLKSDENIKLLLTGYSDKSGSHDYNLKISAKRCETIRDMILDFFPDNQKPAISKRIIIKPQGLNNLLSNSRNETKNHLNRRVEITLTYKSIEDSPTEKIINKPGKITRNNIEVKYKLGIKYFYQRNYTAAGKIFSEIVAFFPGHKLADNAQWWNGEIFYVKQQYQTAVKNFELVFGLGDGNKEAYAQYRIGCCYKELKMTGKAIEELEIVKKLYPDAEEEIEKAQLVLKQIRN